MPIIMVTGSREWTDAQIILDALQKELDYFSCDPSTILIQGGARGADRIAKTIWENTGLTQKEFPADWDRYGRSAGHRRNQQMVDEKPDVVVAFPLGDSPGTRGAIRMAKAAGIRTVIYEGENN